MVYWIRSISWGATLTCVAALAACFSPPPSDGDDGSSGNAANVCVPGETQNCVCIGSEQGVQACNDEGSGYGSCECPQDDSSGATSTPTPGEDTTTSTGPGGDSSDGAGDTTTGAAESTGADTATLPRYEGPYGHCFDGMCEHPQETCFPVPVGIEASVCTILGCNDINDCPPLDAGSNGNVECATVEAIGMSGCVLTCETDDDCLPEATCIGIDVDLSVCVWAVG
ncbi:MAG: hypothetical protein AAF799_47245 [Myxococcota bacterium]